MKWNHRLGLGPALARTAGVKTVWTVRTWLLFAANLLCAVFTGAVAIWIHFQALPAGTVIRFTLGPYWPAEFVLFAGDIVFPIVLFLFAEYETYEAEGPASS